MSQRRGRYMASDQRCFGVTWARKRTELDFLLGSSPPAAFPFPAFAFPAFPFVLRKLPLKAPYFFIFFPWKCEIQHLDKSHQTSVSRNWTPWRPYESQSDWIAVAGGDCFLFEVGDDVWVVFSNILLFSPLFGEDSHVD